jgi:hypothetical protein
MNLPVTITSSVIQIQLEASFARIVFIPFIVGAVVRTFSIIIKALVDV